MFSHSNLRIDKRVDRWLRRVIVTPDMHRVHHSTDLTETDSNYGFNLSLWDRLFRTYISQPKKGHDGIAIGLSGYSASEAARLGRSLALPFVSRPSAYVRRS
jgi:sterol desaturase/sphingolipid hydroxylase (fatty acid hydroxylase superfamily)